MSGRKILMERGQTTDRPKTSPPLANRRAGGAGTGYPHVEKADQRPNAADDATFSVTLLIVHPNCDPDLITKTLKIEPFMTRRQGQPRVTPKGTPLPGISRDTRWNHVAFYEADRTVSLEIGRWMEVLSAHSSFLGSLIASGARISLSVSLPGMSHRGDVIEATTLSRAASLGIGVGFEVFPDWDGKPFAGSTRVALPRRRLER